MKIKVVNYKQVTKQKDIERTRRKKGREEGRVGQARCGCGLLVGLVFNICRPWVPPQMGEGKRERKKKAGEKGKRGERKEGAVRLTSKVAVSFLDILKCPDAITQTRLVLIHPALTAAAAAAGSSDPWAGLPIPAPALVYHL